MTIATLIKEGISLGSPTVQRFSSVLSLQEALRHPGHKDIVLER